MDRAPNRSRFVLRHAWLGTLASAAVLLAACTSAVPASAPTSRATTTSATNPAPGAAPIEISFFYPVAVGGPVTKIIEGYAAEFNKATPGIHVTATFSGSYQDSLTKIQTTLEGGGAPPDTAVLLSTDLYTLKDADYIVPLDDFVKSSGDQFLGDFYDAFMANSKDAGHVYGVPFQRSTPVLYYNKDQFQEVGLKPDQAPKTWADMLDAAKKLTKPDGARWGIEIPSDGFPYWLFQGIAIGNGQNVVGDTANKVTFNNPAIIGALQAWVDLGIKDKVAPAGIVQWATAPNDFTAGKTAMLWHTTGSLTSILKDAKFAVGVGFLPGLKQNGAPTGGGNFYLFKQTPPAKRQAAWKFIQFMAGPEIQARWTVDTGYIAARKSAWDTATLKAYATKAPQVLVALDQLPFAAKELSTHQGPQMQQLLGNQVQAALTGKKSAQQAMEDAQKDADKILAQFKD